MEKFAKLLAITVQALDENPNQDFLGELYMNLNLGNKNSGQFFTPYHIYELMSEITSPPETLKAEIEERGWVSVNDPCVGGGAMFIGYANACIKYGVNYQHTAFAPRVCRVHRDWKLTHRALRKSKRLAAVRSYGARSIYHSYVLLGNMGMAQTSGAAKANFCST